jgi:hypothetical protein
MPAPTLVSPRLNKSSSDHAAAGKADQPSASRLALRGRSMPGRWRVTRHESSAVRAARGMLEVLMINLQCGKWSVFMSGVMIIISVVSTEDEEDS